MAGGATRADSVAAGLEEVPLEALVILVHDAARPLVSEPVIERVLKGLSQGVDGAVPGLPVHDTVKRVEQGQVVETLERAALIAVQTPQAFVAERLRNAYAGDLTGATDCASLVERNGGRVAIVEGDPALIKVTTVDDLAQVEAML